ncbi:MAG TPA: hypothetical protein VN363_04170, partial [Anaerolineales bacterium]|nr:hypothetical protein [Anaerolineales bacterium]
AIRAGTGNGWEFAAEALQASLGLWQGVECFVDHEQNPGSLRGGRSLRDLGGVFENPAWDAAEQAVRLELRTLGPSGGLVEALGRAMLAESHNDIRQNAALPKVGFSADILFTAQGKRVERIVRVFSVDLVFNPARGGAFVRALNSMQMDGVQGGRPMAETMNEMEGAVQEGSPAVVEAANSAGLRAQLSACLLEAGLGAARLPAPLAEHVRQQFSGREVTVEALNRAIGEARGLASALGGGLTVSGPGGYPGIRGMYDTRDQLQAAVDDLLEAPRSPGMQNLKAARLSGIKELYMLLTGDRDLYGGYYAERAQLATTATFPGLVKNAMNKIVAEQWSLLGAAGYDWWKKVVQVEHFETLNQVTGILVGTVGSLPSVAEGGEYTELSMGDSPETADFAKYGGYIPLTLELIDRDNTRKLRQYPRELAKAGMRKLSQLVAAVFSANSGVGPTMADTGALFNATAVTTAGGHANLRTGALSSAEWETVSAAVYNQPLLIRNAAGVYGTGPKQAVDPKYLLVPRELRLTAMKVLYPTWENTANIHSENQQRGELGDVVVVPEWTDAADWAAVVDPRLAPGIVVGERFGLMPEVFIAGDELSPAVFMNDEHRMKVRHFLAVLVQDFRPLHKNNVA